LTEEIFLAKGAKGAKEEPEFFLALLLGVLGESSSALDTLRLRGGKE
jgi:hypothetical protein